jgi:hypothetical protein
MRLIRRYCGAPASPVLDEALVGKSEWAYTGYRRSS